jgi:hypothetical protein
VFQVVSSHTKRIIGVTGPFYGTWNDKTIARLDPNILTKLCEGGDLHKYEWSWEDREGYSHKEKGLYYICDGGYHLWPCLICSFKDQLDGSHKKKWSALLESLGKDVECVFGIMKKRFYVLKHPSRFHKMEDIGNIFRTCCILHNMLIDWDVYDEWGYLFDEDDVDIENYTPSPTQQRSNRSGFSRGTARLYVQPDSDEAEEPMLRDAFDDRRDGLIEHYFASRAFTYN